MILLLVWPSAWAARVPLEDARCDLAGSGIANATGVTHAFGQRVVVDDSVAGLLYGVDAACAAAPLFDTGLTRPSGLAFDGARFAVLDQADDDVHFYGPSGVGLGICDTSALVTDPTGIAWDAASLRFALVDLDEVAFVDGACAPGGGFTLPIGIGSPSDVAWESAGILAIADDADDAIYLVDAGTGAIVDQLDTGEGLGSASPRGLAFDPATSRYAVVDDGVDRLLTVDARGTMEVACPGVVRLGTTGLTIDTRSPDEDYLLVDPITDLVYVVDATTCAETSTIDVGALGILDPSDLAFVAGAVTDDDRLAITDASTSVVSFVEFRDGSPSVAERCDATSSGLHQPTGIDYLADLDQLVITTGSDDAFYLTDRSCGLISVRSAGALERSGAPTSPVGVAVLPGVGSFALIDDATDQLYQANLEGVPLRDLDLAGLGLGDPQGVVRSAIDHQVLSIIDCGIDDIYRLRVNAFVEPLELSGRFCSGLGSMLLFERGDGRVTGTLVSPSFGEVAVSGEFTAGTSRLSLAVEAPNRPIAIASDVDPDLGEIAFPPPLGDSTRQFGTTCPP